MSAAVEAPTQTIRGLGYGAGNVGSKSLFESMFPAAKTKSVFAQSGELIACSSASEPKLPP